MSKAIRKRPVCEELAENKSCPRLFTDETKPVLVKLSFSVLVYEARLRIYLIVKNPT